MANVIVCCDGTWNTADERDGGVPCPTNVAKISNALAKVDLSGAEQRSYYHSGVGTEGSRIEKLLGGAVGDGLDKNIKSAYKWLAQNYRPDDDIYIFGFSRGAYTARYVAGMICSYGLADFSSTNLPDDEMWKRVDRVFDADKANAKPIELADIDFFNTPLGSSGQDKTPIHFLGVWDTVGSLGIPSDLALLQFLENIESYQFQDTVLSNSVLHARHAMAMDEHRQSFTPTLWANVGSHPDAKQIWFAGVHSDVGGGYVQAGLSDIALEWMMDEAEAAGLCFRQGIREQLNPDYHDTLHDSCVGVFSALRTLPRCVPFVSDAGALPAAFHPSVLSRWSNPPIEQTPFWEGQRLSQGSSTAVDIFARERWNYTGVYLEKGTQYIFEATGQWIDGDIKCDPSGGRESDFHLGVIAQKAGSALGKAEKLYQAITQNEQADFWWTKREENFPWFALVGVIANGAGTDKQGNPIPHETFLISKGVTYRPKESGYLYCFANDAWQTYGNNRGSVRLTVKA